jgi:hypothetical protein
MNTIVNQRICVCNFRAFLVRGQLVGLAVGVKTCGPLGCRTYRLYERSNGRDVMLLYRAEIFVSGFPVGFANSFCESVKMAPQ